MLKDQLFERRVGTKAHALSGLAMVSGQCTKLIELFNQEPLNETFVLDTENDGKWGARLQLCVCGIGLRKCSLLWQRWRLAG